MTSPSLYVIFDRTRWTVDDLVTGSEATGWAVLSGGVKLFAADHAADMALQFTPVLEARPQGQGPSANPDHYAPPQIDFGSTADAIAAVINAQPPTSNNMETSEIDPAVQAALGRIAERKHCAIVLITRYVADMVQTSLPKSGYPFFVLSAHGPMDFTINTLGANSPSKSVLWAANPSDVSDALRAILAKL
jgi:hypothetical protein